MFNIFSAPSRKEKSLQNNRKLRVIKNELEKYKFMRAKAIFMVEMNKKLIKNYLGQI